MKQRHFEPTYNWHVPIIIDGRNLFYIRTTFVGDICNDDTSLLPTFTNYIDDKFAIQFLISQKHAVALARDEAKPSSRWKLFNKKGPAFECCLNLIPIGLPQPIVFCPLDGKFFVQWNEPPGLTFLHYHRIATSPEGDNEIISNDYLLTETLHDLNFFGNKFED